MLQLLVKAVFILAEIVKMARAVIKVMVEVKDASLRVAETIREKRQQQTEETRTSSISKDKAAKSYIDLLSYPECEETAYVGSRFFGPSEPDHIFM